MQRYINEIRQLRKREYRLARNLTIAEGYPEVKRALKAGVKIRTLYICPEIFTPQPGEFNLNIIVEVTKDVFKEMAFGHRLKGILAICHTIPHTFKNLELSMLPLLVIVEGIEKPGNLGTIIRTADGAGVDAVIVCEGKTDVYNHNTVRSSIGTIFTVPTIAASNEDTLAFLKEQHIKIFTTSAKATDAYTKNHFNQPCAIVFGNEHDGVSPFWINNAEHHITIPMYGEATSLNAAMSASIIIYEAVRQRQTV